MNDRIKMHVTADLQIFGDVQAADHISRMLAVYTGEEIKPTGTEPHDTWLESVTINHHAKNGPFGLQYVLFTVVMEMDKDELKDAHDIAHKRLAFMTGHNDVDVRWVEPALK